MASGAVALGCLGIWAQQPSWQEPGQQEFDQPPAAVSVTSAGPSQLLPSSGQTGIATRYQDWNQTALSTVAVVDDGSQAKLRELLAKYRDAKSGSEERTDSRAEISQVLSEQYDHLMTQQQQQIEQMEERLAKLREQLQRRREAKSRMVELKLEMVLSQADGLGWPEGSNNWFGQVYSTVPAVSSGFGTLPYPNANIALPAGPATRNINSHGGR